MFKKEMCVAIGKMRQGWNSPEEREASFFFADDFFKSSIRAESCGQQELMGSGSAGKAETRKTSLQLIGGFARNYSPGNSRHPLHFYFTTAEWFPNRGRE
jgi:hypothetical protein